MKLTKLCTIVSGWVLSNLSAPPMPSFLSKGRFEASDLIVRAKCEEKQHLTEQQYLLPSCSQLSWIVDSYRIAAWCFRNWFASNHYLSPKRFRSVERTRNDFRSCESLLARESETSDGRAGFDSQVLPRNAMWQ